MHFEKVKVYNDGPFLSGREKMAIDRGEGWMHSDPVKRPAVEDLDEIVARMERQLLVERYVRKQQGSMVDPQRYFTVDDWYEQERAKIPKRAEDEQVRQMLDAL